MGWSTRQLAELARTTIKAVRHYHDIGLLELPERAANGYKQYNVTHLVRLIQIKRLSDLGVPLAQIAAIESADQYPEQAIRVLDAELAATVERINRVRTELAVLLRHRAPMHVPPEVAALSRTLSDPQHSLLTVYSTVFSQETMQEFREMITDPDPTEAELDALPADADDATIEQLAQRMLPVIRRRRVRYPRTVDPAADSPLGPDAAREAMAHAVTEFYNCAQLRVLQRLHALLTQPQDSDTESR